MNQDTREYVAACTTFTCSKASHQALTGSLQPLPTPNGPWYVWPKGTPHPGENICHGWSTPTISPMPLQGEGNLVVPYMQDHIQHCKIWQDTYYYILEKAQDFIQLNTNKHHNPAPPCQHSQLVWLSKNIPLLPESCKHSLPFCSLVMVAMKDWTRSVLGQSLPIGQLNLQPRSVFGD